MRLYSAIAISLFLLLAAGGPDKISRAAEKGIPHSIVKAKGGYTVEELFAKKDTLNGKKVTVRGKVVKFNSGIMGKNWAHLQDGSGGQTTNDITLTTNQRVKVGDIVVATGVMALDKDFGYGYTYKAIIEDAALTVE